MHDFFKSARFKILIGILIILFAFMLRAARNDGVAPIIAQVIDVVTTPLQQLSSNISDSVTNFFTTFLDASRISEENEQLKEEVRELKQKLVDFEQYKQENEHMKEFLEMKELYPDFVFESASVISRDPNDRFYSFKIDKGSLSGVELNDPVITADGLVGRISEVGLTSSKVVTILDVAMNIGSYDYRTRDTGIVTGSIDLAGDGLCKLNYLPRESSVAAGDLVLTSGSDIFPKGQLIGEITEVKTEASGISLYAVIRPAADIQKLKDVVVIKSFKGQGVKE